VASENAGLSILIVGGTVLVLSVAWQPLRRIVLQILPHNVRNLVPPAAAPTNRHSREGGNPTLPAK
jgi:hypothetical protein